jgi:N-acetylglucosaminyldiphosphoundecaprenol N-acetyl-beta-D-mannosaminyltransferase
MTIPDRKLRVNSVLISTGRYDDQVTRILDLGRERSSSYVVCVNAHMVAEAWRDPAFAVVVNEADISAPDGMPVMRMLQMVHGVRQERVAGNDLMPSVIAGAESRGLRLFLYGSTAAVLEKIKARIARDHPDLVLAGTYSPPFRNLTTEDLDQHADRIQASEANIVLVALGCPRQERWMASMKGKIDSVMLGVGGAFPLYAGIDTRAPLIVRQLSLEWMVRLLLEPRRLWKRYLVTNSIFIWLSVRTLIGWTGRGEDSESIPHGDDSNRLP